MDRFLNLAGTAAFVAALILGGLAALELVLQFRGHSLLGHAYSAGRLLEFAGIAMIFAIGIDLRARGFGRQ